MRDIVLVHSNEKTTELYRKRLAQHFGVKTHLDGISAIRSLRESKPHLVIAEYDLPWISGVGILKFVRSTPSISHVPVIIVSHREPQISALNHGANDWIKTTDATVDELIQKVFYHLITNKVLK